MKTIRLLTTLKLALFPLALQAQLELNATASFELSRGGDKSHYFYNEIHEGYSDWRFGLAQANLMAAWPFAGGWRLQGRLLLERKQGERPEQLRLPQLNLQWAPQESPLRFTLGRFLYPFGAFNGRQLPTERTFIARPLAYSYYVNISEKAGFFPGMGDEVKVPADGNTLWGSTMLYYGGYAAGMKLHWEIKARKAWLDAAVVNGAPNVRTGLPGSPNWGITSRFSVQPRHWWKQGFSLAYGTFMERADINAGLEKMKAYRQALIGTDYLIGFGYFELSGELIAATYRAPQHLPEEESFAGKALHLKALAGHGDIRYSLPFLGGAYLAYRFGMIHFGRIPGRTDRWDNGIKRHSLAAGYRINSFLLVQASVSTQQVNEKQWARRQQAFRLMLTAFY